MGYETSKLITSDTDLERGNAQPERYYDLPRDKS